MSTSATVEIINVRTNSPLAEGEESIHDQITAGLSRPAGHKSLPTMLLYDERGLRLYDNITTQAPEYYLFSAEEEILKQHANKIARVMHSVDHGNVISGEMVVELGAGSLRKTSHILSALADLIPPSTVPPITYYALDLQERELERTLKELKESEFGNLIRDKVATRGLCATFHDGLKLIREGGLDGRSDVGRLSARVSEQYKLEKAVRDQSPSSTSEASSGSSGGSSDNTSQTPPSTPGGHYPLHLLFLGSSLGNFPRGEDAAFLRSLPLRPGSGDTVLIGLDHDNDPQDIDAAYNDPKGLTEQFILNGLKCTGKILGDESLFINNKWAYVGRYNQEERRHEAFYKSLEDQTIVDPFSKVPYAFKTGELVRIEVSHKYSEKDVHRLFLDANLRPIHRWTDSSSRYSLWLLERPPFLFSALPSSGAIEAKHSPFSMPTVDEWQTMWAAWDFITQRMIPPSMLFQKPIDLRHICLFYLGHIPTFLSIHLSRLLGEPDTEPVYFQYIFERGIDPNVDDPTQCHSHSKVPTSDEDWPSVTTILEFQHKVRQRVLKLYEDLGSGAVTLTRRIGRVLFMTLEHEAMHAETLLYMLLQRAGTGTLPPTVFSPPVWSVLADSWDRAPQSSSKTVNLGPATITVGHDDDEADDNSREVAGHEFGWDNEHPKRTIRVNEFKVEWRPVTNGEFYQYYVGKGKDTVKFPASWVEVEGEIFVRTLYGPVPIKIAWNWPIITSFDNMSTYASVQGGRLPTEPELRLFHDMFDNGYEGGGNVGFRNWHPIPATTGEDRNGGKGHNGGVFEWTSTVLGRHEGFVPSRLYPGYSMDFFDGQHQVVIGGSYATIPRLAQRRTLRNFYQHNYPYAWVGARIAYDV